jgi:hypothetical protein
MTPKEYAEANKHRPLSDREREKGKDQLTYYGSTELIPWSEIYTRVRAGQPIEDICKIYGNERKIVAWIIEDKIEYSEEYEDLVVTEIEQRRKVEEIAKSDPIAARTLKEIVNEYAPDVNKLAATLSSSILSQAVAIAKRPTATSTDLLNLATAQQKTLDTLGISQRHAAASQQTNNQYNIQGFTFVEDKPPETIDADIIQDGDAS